MEVAETLVQRQRGGEAGEALVAAQRSRTDTVAEEYIAVARQAAEAVPDLSPVLNLSIVELSALNVTRSWALGNEVEETSADESYDALIRSLLTVADAIPSQITAPELAMEARGIAALASMTDLAAQQRTLLRTILIRGSFAPGELSRLASLYGAEQTRQEDFLRIASPRAQSIFNESLQSQDVTDSRAMIEETINTPSGQRAPQIDADAWYIAQSHTIRRMYTAQVDIAVALDEASAQLHRQERRHAALVIGGVGAFILLTLGIAVLLATWIGQRLHRLHQAALEIANQKLPESIDRISQAVDPQAVRDAELKAAGQAAESLSAGPSDEIGEVAAALGTVHHQALRLAADQALLRLDTAATLAALSRRSQTLIHRQLTLLDDIERSEVDPDRLQQLFALDHLVTRMRRNEENLLVLAGGEPGRRFTTSYPLEDVIRAAASEIEDYTRVEPVHLDSVSVIGRAVGDVVHLLAELLENATLFSPPNSKVTVTTRRSIDGLEITIYDEGIGIPEPVLQEANERLAHPGALTSRLARTMGLLVVARLAARHQIQVQLRSQEGKGTTAFVRLPSSLLAPLDNPLSRLALSRSASDSDRRTSGQLYQAASSPLPRRPTVAATSTAPSPPSPPLSQPSAPSSQPTEARASGGTTRAGLPYRIPGAQLMPGAVPDPEPAQQTRSDPGIDPELIRNRLSSLSSGIAAAARHLGGASPETIDDSTR